MPTKICEKKNFVVTLPTTSVKALILILDFNKGVSLNLYVVYKIMPRYLSVILVFNLVVVVTSTSVRYGRYGHLTACFLSNCDTASVFKDIR